MSEKQNPKVDTDNSSPGSDQETAREKSERPSSYYYDDTTGYEIYDVEKEDEDVEEP